MKKTIRKIKNEDGFTLIEMTIVVVVIAILLIVFLPNVEKVNTRVTDTTDQALVKTVEAQKILYKAQHGEEANSALLETAGYITTPQKEAYDKLLEAKKK